MKILKSKFMTLLVITGLMFGFLSFSTSPVVAQDTNSNATSDLNSELAALPAVVFFVVRAAAWAAGFELGTRLIGGSNLELEYPADALDQSASPF